MGAKSVLIIDKKITAKSELLAILKKKGLQVFTVAEGAFAVDLLSKQSFFCLISGDEGLRAMQRKSGRPFSIPIVYLKKTEQVDIGLPLVVTLKDPIDVREAEKVFDRLLAEVNCPSLIAKSPVMQKVLQRVQKIAKSHANIFIFGESGTGKEVIASHIHAFSKRAAFPFIRVNCAALPDTLIESEFFGHEKGAFTGAHVQRVGRFERAHQGTLLLDEISEISTTLQAKLLRIVQEGEFERVGGKDPLYVDVRLISTSNCDMKEALQKHRFREDLYYRLNVIPLFLPPLRKRKEDILPLAEYFLQQTCLRNELTPRKFSARVAQRLVEYDWPGNVRELSNVVEHSAIMAHTSEIMEVLFDLAVELKSGKTPQNKTLKAVEKEHILATLARHHAHKGKTAEELGISVRTLRSKLKSYRLE